MNSRERVLRTLKFEATDRVPFGIFGTNPPDEERMAKDLKYNSVLEMYKNLELDIWHFFQPLKYKGRERSFMGKPADFWGVPFDIRSFGDSSVYNPLAEISSVDEVEAYEFPKIEDFDASDFDKELDQYEGFAIEGGLWAPFFHNVTWLCGFENTLANLASEPEIVKALLRKVIDFWIDYAKLTLQTAKGRVHIMQNCNDFGTQLDLIMSRTMFCEFFKPELKRLYDVIKSYDVAVLQHSCGSIINVIDDFIEIGVDIMNPVQVNARGMEIENIASSFGGKTCFYGGIDTQQVLPLGPESRIREAVQKTLTQFKHCGGYILGPSQGIEADISTQNACVMFDEGKKFYGIK